jgi:hypothetical protein
MLKKIAFVCGTPLVKLSLGVFDNHEREYYEWLCQMAKLGRWGSSYKEIMEVYGESQIYEGLNLFEERREGIQLLYVQSRCGVLLKRVFLQSDLVVMELPERRTQFDPIFMSIFPWKDQIMFLWDTQRRQGTSFLNQFCNEYKLKETQIIPIKRDVQGKLRISW